jgi:hypothetical protein
LFDIFQTLGYDTCLVIEYAVKKHKASFIFRLEVWRESQRAEIVGRQNRLYLQKTKNRIKKIRGKIFSLVGDEPKDKISDQFIPERSLGRYSYADPKDIIAIDTGERVVHKSKVKKLRSKEAWLTNYGRLIKVITV